MKPDCVISNEHTSSRFFAKKVWEKANGPIPKGMGLYHTCDAEKCENLNHLWIGYPWQNSQDMVKKGRAYNGMNKPSMILINGKMTPYIKPQEDKILNEKIRREKISKAKKGVSRSEETKFRISQGQCKRLNQQPITYVNGKVVSL